MQTGVWKSKDGRETKICDMDNRHLINTTLFLERIAKKKYDNSWENYVRPVYWCMIEEVEDRVSNGRLAGVSVVKNSLVFGRDVPLGISRKE